MTAARPMRLPAPAKLNLFLHILGRRADGYHELQTLFQLLDHGDWLEFTPNPLGQVRLVNAIPGVPDAQNLILRAARLLEQAAPSHRPRLGIDIRLDKRLPMGGGLGGGSSDAATTLHALNQLWGLGLSSAELAELGLSLGADVPVFVLGHTAWGEGVGERLTPLPAGHNATLPETWFVVIKPDCEVPTARVFSDPRLTRNTPKRKIAPAVEGCWESLDNDCEAVVKMLFPPVHRALDWLRDYAPARLTGTGSCIFAPVSSPEQADEILGQLPTEWQGFKSRGVSESPLLRALKEQQQHVQL